ncbi:MAG: 50S ribosomal protein L21 [Candidatus Niyogibacteria bacterium]|nr:50S ribosomal protein L21 [Candidatus Niyogibacteria bacterium]
MEKKTSTKKAPTAAKPVKTEDFFAIVETGGKQYLVQPGTTLKVEKLPPPMKGGEIKFDKVLLIKNAKGVQLGHPYIDGAAVMVTWQGDGRNKKVMVFRYHSKTRYRKNKGHRQAFTKVTVNDLR